MRFRRSMHTREEKCMQNLAMAIAGLACLMISGFALYKLAPREGKPGIPWMEVEVVGISVSLVLVTLVATGAALLIAAMR
jgi:hypothetical protein